MPLTKRIEALGTRMAQLYAVLNFILRTQRVNMLSIKCHCGALIKGMGFQPIYGCSLKPVMKCILLKQVDE